MHTFPCGCRVPTLGDGRLDVRPETLPDDLGCKAVWDLLATGRTKGVFQLESSMARDWTRKLRPESDEHVGALGAILRPGCLNVRDNDGVSVTEHYCLRKNGLEEAVAAHPALEGALRATFALMLYQEQMMRLAAEVANFTKAQQGQLRKCVSGDTRLVSKTRGWVTIERLMAEGYQDDKFLVMNERGESCWKRIVDIWSNGKKAVRKVTAAGGNAVWATKHHQFLTATGWKARSRLVETDHLVAARRVAYEGQETVGRDLAVVIAGIATEGSFVEGKQARFTNHDPWMMEVFCSAAERAFGRRPTEMEGGKVAGLVATERELVNRYIPFGKSATKQFAEEMMGETLETTRDFLSFALAAEGGITEATGHFEWSSKSPKFAGQVRLLLLRFGVRTTASEFEVEGYGKFWRLGISDIRDQRNLFRELTGLWPECKKQALAKRLDRTGTFTTDVVPQSISVRMIDQYPFCTVGESGTAYTASLSRERFRRLAEKTGDSSWVKLTDGDQWYPKLESVSDDAKDGVEVFDFTVEGGDTPYVVANGLVIHNCAGKKDQTLMSKMGLVFVEEAVKTGKVTRAEAEQMFDAIRKSAKYLFNKSHAISYGLTGIETAWFKAHLPVAFFAGWLSEAKGDSDPRQEMMELVGDARHFGVTVLPPDARELSAGVSVTDQTVRFGLADARGAGPGQVDTLARLVTEAEAGGSRPKTEWSWAEWLGYTLSPVKGGVKKNVAEAWVGCGAFDFTGVSRTRMQKEYSAVAESTEREIPALRKALSEARDVAAALTRFADVPRKEGGPSDKRRRSAVLDAAKLLTASASSDADHPTAIAGLEEHLLGVALTCSRVDGCDRSAANWTCKQFNSGVTSARMVLAVEVKDVRPKRTKKGDAMAYLTVDDGTDSVEATAFPDAFAAAKPILYAGNCVVLEGRKDKKFGSFVVDKAHQLVDRPANG